MLQLVQESGLFLFQGVAGFNINAVFDLAYSQLLSLFVASSAGKPGKFSRRRNFFYNFDEVSGFANREMWRRDWAAIFWFDRSKAIASDRAGFGQLAIFSSILFDERHVLRGCHSSQSQENHCDNGVAQLQWISLYLGTCLVPRISYFRSLPNVPRSSPEAR